MQQLNKIDWEKTDNLVPVVTQDQYYKRSFNACIYEQRGFRIIS